MNGDGLPPISVYQNTNKYIKSCMYARSLCPRCKVYATVFTWKCCRSRPDELLFYWAR